MALLFYSSIIYWTYITKVTVKCYLCRHKANHCIEKKPIFHAKSRQWIIMFRSICKDLEINFPTVESQKCIYVVTWDRSSKNSRQIPYLKIVHSLSGCLGYHAPMDLFIELNHMSSKLEEPLPQGKQINLCVGKEWYRFPSSFFLPSER